MATLADGGRITTDLVEAEIQRLQWLWPSAGYSVEADMDLNGLLAPEMAEALNLFDRSRA